MPNKKGTKEVGPGEALNCKLPLAKAALSWEPLPARTWVLPEALNLDPDFGENVPIFSEMVSLSDVWGKDFNLDVGIWECGFAGSGVEW